MSEHRFGGPPAVIVAAALVLGAAGAQAQLEEVVVTAQKREQSLQDVGLSIAAIDEETFRESGARNIDNFAAQLTNVEAYASNTFIQTVYVRGIGLNEFQGQYDSPVGLHYDEVYIAKPWMRAYPTFDLDRVEVLKGPQGTLFGRNTTGGAVNFYTQAPTETFDAYAELEVNNFEHYLLEAAAGGPIAGNLLGRLSFLGKVGNGGPQENLFTGDEHGRPDLQVFRGQLAWSNADTRVRFLVEGGRDEGDRVSWKGPGIYNGTGVGPGNFCPEVFTGEVIDDPATCAKFDGLAAAAGVPEAETEPNDKFTINQNNPSAVDDRFYGGYLRLEHDLGNHTLTSITAYNYYERNHKEDSESDILIATETHYYNEMNQFTQELRLTGDLTPQWHYATGLYYENDDLEEVDGSDLSGNPFNAVGLTPPFAQHFFADFEVDFESVAAFFHSELDFSEVLTLNLGVRYTQDSTKIESLTALGLNDPQGKEDRVTPCLITTFINTPIGSPACPFLGPPAPNGGVFEDNRHNSNLSWRAGFTWAVSDDWMVYANLTTGYRNGGYSSPFAGAVTQFEPEEVFSKEIGFKADLLDRTLRVNGVFFHYDYDDVQINVDDPVSPLVPITRNLEGQKSAGIELDAWWTPSERWLIHMGAAWLDAELESERTFTAYNGVVPLDGKRPVNTPKWTYNGSVRYEQPIMDGWSIALMSNFNYVDDRFLEVSNQAFDKADSYWKVDMRGAVISQDGRWELAVYGRNVFDEEYISYMNNVSFFKLDIYGQPASYGASLRYRFQ